jgi:hypothetical protein
LGVSTAKCGQQKSSGRITGNSSITNRYRGIRTFSSPTGLAWLDTAHLIVADQRKASIYVIDLSGKITGTISLTQTK